MGVPSRSNESTMEAPCAMKSHTSPMGQIHGSRTGDPWTSTIKPWKPMWDSSEMTEASGRPRASTINPWEIHGRDAFHGRPVGHNPDPAGDSWKTHGRPLG